LKWLGRHAEHTHDLLQTSILEQAVKFDDFFGTANSKKEQTTAYLLRWRTGLRFEDNGHVKFTSNLRADLRLSKIDERLRLTFSGESESDRFAPRLPEDPGTPGFDRTFPTTRIVNTELRYQFVQSLATSFFAGAGLDLTIPPQLFVRSRYEHRFRLAERVQLRAAQTIFAKTSDGLGETTELSVERSLDPKTLLRLNNSGTLSEEVGWGMEWGSELSLLHALSEKSAVTVAAGVFGNTGVEDGITDYRVYLRYRRNFLRKWLFYELEPELSWPRRDDDSFPTTYAFTFRLEVVFEGKETKRAGVPSTGPEDPSARGGTALAVRSAPPQQEVPHAFSP